MSFWTAVVIIVAITAFVNLRMAKIKAQGGSYAPDQAQLTAHNAQLLHEVEDLRERVRVLERITTDNHQSDSIAKEIESLRDR